MEPKNSTVGTAEATTQMATQVEMTSVQDAIYIRNQQESPFLRLPAELRNEIYKYVVPVRKRRGRRRRRLIIFEEPEFLRPFAKRPNYTDLFGVDEFQVLLWDNSIKIIVPDTPDPWKSKIDHSPNLTFNLKCVCRQTRSDTGLFPFTPRDCKAFLPSLITCARLLQLDQRDAIRTFRLFLFNSKEIDCLYEWDTDPAKLTGQDITSIEALTRRFLQHFRGIQHLIGFGGRNVTGLVSNHKNIDEDFRVGKTKHQGQVTVGKKASHHGNPRFFHNPNPVYQKRAKLRKRSRAEYFNLLDYSKSFSDLDNRWQNLQVFQALPIYVSEEEIQN